MVEPSTHSAHLASKFLEEIQEKEASHFTAHAVFGGMMKALNFYEREEVDRNAFNTPIQILAGTGKDINNRSLRQLVNAITDRFERFEDGTQGMRIKYYLASILSRLNFVCADSPLYVINCCHRIITALVGKCLPQLQVLCTQAPNNPSQSSDTMVRRLREEGATAALLVQLASHLSKRYRFKADKIKAFAMDHSDIDRQSLSDRERKVGPDIAEECDRDFEFIPEKLFQSAWAPGRDLLVLESDINRLSELAQSLSYFASDDVATEPLFIPVTSSRPGKRARVKDQASKPSALEEFSEANSNTKSRNSGPKEGKTTTRKNGIIAIPHERSRHSRKASAQGKKLVDESDSDASYG